MARSKKLVLKTEIRAEDRASRVVKKTEGRFRSFGKFLSTGFVAAAALAVGAIIGITKALTGSIRAAQVQEDAIKSLDAALADLGTRGGEVSKSLQAFAAEQQKVTRFGDEQIIQAQALLASFVKEEEALKIATKASLDLAAAKGIDLKVAADLIAKSLGSSTNALSRYGIAVEGAVGSTERLTSLAGNLERVFGGRAQADALTFAGQVQQVSNAWGDLAEKVGDGIIKNETILKTLGKLKAALTSDGVVQGVEQFADGIGNVIKGTQAWWSQNKELLTSLADVIVSVGRLILQLRDVLEPVIAGINQKITALADGLSFLLGWVGKGVTSFGVWVGVLEESADAAGDLADKTEKLNVATRDQADATQASSAALQTNAAATEDVSKASDEAATKLAEVNKQTANQAILARASANANREEASALRGTSTAVNRTTASYDRLASAKARAGVTVGQSGLGPGQFTHSTIGGGTFTVKSGFGGQA